MFEVYLLITLALFIINGIAYSIFLMNPDENPTMGQIFRIAIIYVFISLLWPVQVFYLFKMGYEDFKNGKSN